MQESGIKNKIREQGPKKPIDKRAKVAPVDANMELGEEELSEVAGGHCVKGEHIPKVKIIV